jgi:beta-ureidopropionase / N-carbamoyl-L-amino-acid hydrolase
MSSNLPVNAARIAEDIDALARLTEPGRPWTRRVFSPLFLEGRAYIEARMRAAGLETRIDAAGNLIGRRSGRAGTQGVLMLGSHSDTVPDGGRFDGIAGVVAALEVARSLAERGVALAHDLEVVDFLAEEVSPFGVSCIGSRGMTAQMPETWLTRRNESGALGDALVSVGGDPAVVLRLSRPKIAAFLELHIEQGPVLERQGRDIGLVTGIVGITRFEILVEGRPDHAGTTPMDARADALVAASDLVLKIHDEALRLSRTPSHFAATVGEFAMAPNAANVVPGRVRLLVDARAERRPDMEAFATWLDQAAKNVATAHGAAISAPARVSDSEPIACDPHLFAVLENAAKSTGMTTLPLVSGAGHDAAWIARVAPAAMIFVPSRDGRSHAPDEWTDNDAIARGAAVLFEAVLALDAEPEMTKT